MSIFKVNRMRLEIRMTVAIKDNIEGVKSVTPNFPALDWDLFRLFDPLIALWPRSTACNAFMKIIIYCVSAKEVKKLT